MRNDTFLQLCLVWLAVLVVVTGLYTQSLKKMAVTYLFGMFAVCGIVLPDWEFFDRAVSRWGSPLTVDGSGPSRSIPSSARFRFYPIRLVVYTAVYGFALYKWWKFISS